MAFLSAAFFFRWWRGHAFAHLCSSGDQLKRAPSSRTKWFYVGIHGIFMELMWLKGINGINLWKKLALIWN